MLFLFSTVKNYSSCYRGLKNVESSWKPPEGWITVKQAAAALKVTDRTIRNRIQREEIKAKLVDSPYGKTWVISLGDLAQAQQIIDTVVVHKETELKDFAFSLHSYMEKYLEAREKPMLEKMESLSEQIDNLINENKALRNELEYKLEKRDQKLIEALRKTQEENLANKSWFAKIFNK